MTTSWVRSRAPSLVIARLTCVREVAGLMKRWPAISSFARHPDVHEDDVGYKGFRQAHRFGSVTRLAHDFDVLAGAQKGFEAGCGVRRRGGSLGVGADEPNDGGPRYQWSLSTEAAPGWRGTRPAPAPAPPLRPDPAGWGPASEHLALGGD